MDSRPDDRPGSCLDVLRLRFTITIDLSPSYDGAIGFSTRTIDDWIGANCHYTVDFANGRPGGWPVDTFWITRGHPPPLIKEYQHLKEITTIEESLSLEFAPPKLLLYREAGNG